MISPCIQPSIGPCIRPCVNDPRAILYRRRFSPDARDYFTRLGDLRVMAYNKANARAIDRLVEAGGNLWPDSGAFNAMAGYLYPSGGTLIPLKAGHDAGTLVDFVTGDWNAVTGLKGDGSSKYVNSNRNNNADGQNDVSVGCYVTLANGTSDRPYIRASASSVIFSRVGSFLQFRLNRLAPEAHTSGNGSQLGYVGMTRNNDTTISAREGNATTIDIAQGSSAPGADTWMVFDSTGNGRLPFYHIGANLNGTGQQALLDTILTDWQTDLANA